MNLKNLFSKWDEKFKDHCGVFGCISKSYNNDPAMLSYCGLFALQHRGQESAGISVLTKSKKIICHKDNGYVGDIFNQKVLNFLSKEKANASIGHVRYSTAGSKTVKNAQPFVVKTKIGDISLAHNGNLINVETLRKKYLKLGVKFISTVDSELILKIIAYHIDKQKKSLEDAIIEMTKEVIGAYSLVILANDKLIGLRDPYAIRPLCIGKNATDTYFISSESCVFSSTGATLIRDVERGEMVIIDKKLNLKSIIYQKSCPKKSCIFEYVYFARPDSTIDKINCYESRIKQGEMLYKEHPLKADLVIAVPESGNYAAMGYAKASKIPFGIGLIKNRYIARTFIKPSQKLREQDVYFKLNPLEATIKNKNIVLIDDSIVRGSSSFHIIQALKKHGAKKVYFLSASPMVKHPCYLGIDTPTHEELIGHKHTVEQVRKMIKTDYLGYLSIKGLFASIKNDKNMCTGCFDGKYAIYRKE